MNIEELKLRAAFGDAEAQFELGKAYECGRDVVVNLWESVKWFYVEKDVNKAIEMYKENDTFISRFALERLKVK
ncbi:MAG: hypothetical protein IKL56_06780 [Bacteroidaceae bacterium]|nr:hypothetical protein [Bacteroidaceae bacterium]